MLPETINSIIMGNTLILLMARYSWELNLGGHDCWSQDVVSKRKTIIKKQFQYRQADWHIYTY